MGLRKRILFVAESVTLAHVARPYALARALDPERFEVVFACADTYLALFPDWPWRREPLASIPPQLFMQRLAGGRRLYPLATLRQYAADDLRLIETVRPDAIVGDFRLSLSASARAAKVPYAALTNAYWSPYAARRRVPVPCLPMTRLFGVPIANALFSLSRPLAFAWHTVPLNLLRRDYGLPMLGPDLRRVYTDADLTLYADVPELVPTEALPPHHRYLGAIEWSPPIPMPALPWEGDAAERPLVYVTMGSSGSAELLPSILEALSGLDCRVAVATAGVPLRSIPPNALAADYLPGDRLAESARLVVCNGGSPTSHQALARGVPVLGIPSNLDQHLNMDCVAACGAGLALRPEYATPSRLRAAALALLRDPSYRDRAAALAQVLSGRDPAAALARHLEDITEKKS